MADADNGRSNRTGQYAIVGIGCRLPGGVHNSGTFWDMLAKGRDAIGPVPEDRPDWAALYDPDPAATGRIYAKLGGFINDIDKFDARFFGISPREAVHIDPQHRFLLETVWQAFEDARIPLDKLAGSDTGVFVGISTHDYGDVQMDPRFHDRIALHTNSGCATSIAANRISFTYDLRGPSMSVDTACSSALTATHLACTALDAGDCSLAVVGGVQLLLRPELTMGFCRATMLSVDGHCKAFDAAGNGYVRAEGVGAVVLKPLEAALADGDRIYAVVLGTSVNQDGRTSSLTIPNEVSQRAMLQTSLARAGVDPAKVQYVEAHGPGTAVGDPIEARAIGSVFGEGRPDNEPLLIGSVKTNIGHLEAGSGIAGLIKAALAISHRQVPPSLHFNTWNPAIDPDALKLRVATELQPWPENGERPLAAINSFGFGGANASVVLGAAPDAHVSTPAENDAANDVRPYILPISAQTPEALRRLALAHSDLVLGGKVSLAAQCGAAALGRSHLDERIAIVAGTASEFADALDAAIAGESDARVVRGRNTGMAATQKTAFVFSGMGPQWWGMGRQLLDTEPVFAAMMERCDAALRPHSGWSLIDEFRADEAVNRIAHPQLAQVSNFALQVSLAQMWRELGIEPGAVIGHSGGAMAAAHIAGVHTLEQAIWLCYHRSQMQGRDSNSGEMLAIGLPANEVLDLIKGHEDRIAIAAINGPKTVTLSGDGAVLRPIAAALTEQKIFARLLAVTIAYHSPRMDPIREEFLATVRDLEASSAALPFVSDTTGTWHDGADCDADYWWRAIRSPVRFADSINTLAQDGFTAFVEVSPHPVLAASIGECLREAGKTGVVVPSLRRNEDERATMLRSLGALYVNGAEPAWNALYQRDVSVDLADYPFERERHWFDPDDAGAQHSVGEADTNPLLGMRLPGAQPIWETRLDAKALAWVADHLVQEQVVMPGASYVAMALAAARRLEPEGTLILRDLSFQRPLIVGDDKPRAQIAIDGNERSFNIFSRSGGRASWTRHAQGLIGKGKIANPPAVNLSEVAARLGELHDVEAFYAAVFARGLVYGPAFMGIQTLRTDSKEALVTVGPIDGLATDPDSIHPALLDAAFQALIAIANLRLPDDSRTFLPVSIDEVRLYRPTGGRFHVHCSLDALYDLSAKASFRICADDGEVLLSIIGLTARMINSGVGDGGVANRCLYEYRWEPLPLQASAAAPSRTGLLQLAPDMADAMHAICAGTEQAAGWSSYYTEAEPLLSGVAAGHVLAALAELGVVTSVGSTIDAAALAHIRSEEPSGGAWTDRLLGLLEETGCIARNGDNYTILRVPDITPANAAMSGQLARHHIDLALLEQAGRTLGGALGGSTAGRDAIFTADSLPLLTQFYRDAPGSDFYNRILAGSIKTLVEKASAGGIIRVLEIGAGTGGATAAVLGVLPPEQTHYVFTDNAAMLLDGARTLFGGINHIEFRNFDLTRDAQDQGFDHGSFDLIIAANVVHATPDIAESLGRLRSLLLPGGTLAMIEITRHPRWLDVIFGQTRGWWAFTDRALRAEHPLLEGAQWRQQLEAARFDNIVLSNEPAAAGEAAQTVILAARPTDDAAVPIWLMLAAEQDVSTRIARAMAEVGCRTTIITDEDAVDTCLDMAVVPFAGIIDLRGLALPDSARAGRSNPVFATLSLTRRLLKRDQPLGTPLWLVTGGGAQLAGGDAAQATVLGFGRTAIKEHGELALRMADLGLDPTDQAIAAFVREITEHDRDEEIAFDGATRHVRRLRRQDPVALPKPALELPLQWHAAVGTAGSLSSLYVQKYRPMPLGPHDVRVKVEAASLNFRDVVLAMGSIQGLEESDTSTGRGRLGSDCAGIVQEVGSAVTRFSPGDAVMGMAPVALGTMVVAPEQCLVHKPGLLSFAEASALPTVAITALYALKRIGRLAKGERVLIHSATGGVGLAAIQIAQAAGAEIFATAGTDLKREYLRSLGITHVMDSRSIDFADEIAQITGGEGVDVVLNSLSGEAIACGMASLAPYGRFVEIGKADIYANSGLPMGDFKRNLTFASFDLDQMTKDRPDQVGELLAEIAHAVDHGQFKALPIEAMPMSNMEEAFRKMTVSRHVGKIVLVNDGAQPDVPERFGIDCYLRADGSYLITGGLGGFGLTVAEHLAKGRPEAIVLLGRNPPNAVAAARIEAIRAQGVQVEVLRGDVAKADDIAQALATIAGKHLTLRGVFHSAMVLDDQRLATMDDESLERVMVPKAAGAWILHQATQGMALDHFVMFSSITSLLGNPLQANYAAANAYLDALAHQRQAMGLPALTINWGVLAGAGYVADRPDLQRFLDQQGYLSFTKPEALEALDIALGQSSPQIMTARIDWGQMAAYSARSAASPRLAHLIPSAADQAGRAAVSSEIVQALAQADDAEKTAIIEAFLIKALARILGMNPEIIDVERSLDSFGLDSLLSVEFMVVLSGELDFEMPVIALLDDMSIRTLGGLILADLATRGGSSALQAPAMPQLLATAPVAAPEPLVIPAAPIASAQDGARIAESPETPAPSAPPPYPAIEPDLSGPVMRDWTPLQKGARSISRAGVALLGKVDVQGLENLPDGPFILAVNHLSMADVPLALSTIPRKTVMLANAKLQNNWLLDQLVGRLGEAIYLPKAGDVGPALEQALDVLRHGGVLALAPEGTRNANGLGRAETGIAWLASRSGLPVVPYAAWGQEKWRDCFKRFDRLALNVRIGAPIAPPAANVGARDYADQIMRAIAALLPAHYHGVYAGDDVTA